ncbi:MAG: hypothetical protein WD431_07710 [Cyclobacteriaceae bacterium]
MISVQAQNWETIDTPDNCTKRHECASAAVGNKVYLLGGRGMKPVEEFDPLTKKWTQKSMAPIEMHHFQAVSFNDKIYVIGAFTGGYPHETPIPHVYIYDPSLDQWSKGHEIPEGRRRGAAGVVVYQTNFI